MPNYYDKKGKPLELMEWTRLFEDDSDPPYRQVAETTLPDGKWISTVWLGFNHRFGDGAPLIFETMVFRSIDNLDELDGTRYSTLAEAEAGHISMISKWRQSKRRIILKAK